MFLIFSSLVPVLVIVTVSAQPSDVQCTIAGETSMATPLSGSSSAAG